MSQQVLICDDSALARKQVKKSLPADWDVEVQFATNGLEALEVLKSTPVRVLFLDLTMPELDGIGVLEWLQANPVEQLSVIVISADIQPAMQQKVDELGAQAFIRKPINGEALNQVLTQQGLM